MLPGSARRYCFSPRAPSRNGKYPVQERPIEVRCFSFRAYPPPHPPPSFKKVKPTSYGTLPESVRAASGPRLRNFPYRYRPLAEKNAFQQTLGKMESRTTPLSIENRDSRDLKPPQKNPVPLSHLPAKLTVRKHTAPRRWKTLDAYKTLLRRSAQHRLVTYERNLLIVGLDESLGCPFPTI